MSDLPKDLEPTDSDEVDYRIDPTMMMENLRLTPAERLERATQVAHGWADFLSHVRRQRRE